MTSTIEKPKNDQREKLYSIIKGCHTAFLVTKSLDGRLHGRPMASAEIDQKSDELWFATRRSSLTAAELRNDHDVFLGYNNASGSEWASISGTARVVDDRTKAKQLWNAFWKNWFDGPDDPELVLLRVTPQQGEYWDAGSRLWQLAKFALVAVTGKKVDEGEHGKVAMSN